MKKLILILLIATFAISCKKTNQRNSGDCRDCTWTVISKIPSHPYTVVQGYEDWVTSTNIPLTYCGFLDTLKLAYPNNVIIARDLDGNIITYDTIIYNCP